jgi:lipopolysaccharide transport protein LptA
MGNLASKFCVGVLLCTTVCTALAAQEKARSEALVLEADSLNFNRQTNQFEARHPRIVQGNVRVQADESAATGDDFQRSTEWRFKGHVKITVDATVLEADSAVFTLDQGQVSRADLEGTPASFTNRESNQQMPVRGSARRLEYDHVARTLHLSGDAQISKEQYQIQGCDLIYEFKAERWVSGPSDCGVRVVVPQKQKAPQAPAAATSPQ